MAAGQSAQDVELLDAGQVQKVEFSAVFIGQIHHAGTALGRALGVAETRMVAGIGALGIEVEPLANALTILGVYGDELLGFGEQGLQGIWRLCEQAVGAVVDGHMDGTGALCAVEQADIVCGCPYEKPIVNDGGGRGIVQPRVQRIGADAGGSRIQK